ncbi:acetyl-CoA synthetase-like protein [Gloeophyllum trabeum ATCC 11539]|uniref:Acetyl-CoA synthetase-like protein n=1 Tax=Gloeophyllum trabeum (strain ATCC 11539 / FP-39264 / Madison 617) TaxID=670483 RepID=S7RI04_GLOTA|nr:acetyl-CoA synthetase-like protein [Gloeophyllum trabeum ATCC 11539]EPQ52234.1 acetyl-CoA synthetase-like protein [Gloeophyllum trabeum ATCC 11539]
MAHIVRPEPASGAREVVALMMNTDTLMYTTTMMAVVRAGLIPYPMSIRNPPATVAHLLQKTSCHRLITTSSSLGSIVAGVQAELASVDYQLQVKELPSLFDAFPYLGHEKSSDPSIPYPRLNHSKMDDIVTYLHSSGSTGLPKSIPHTNKTVLGWFAVALDMFRYPRHLKFGVPHLPTFHVLGAAFQVWYPLLAGTTVAFFTPTYPDPPPIPNLGNILEAVKRSKVNALTSVPTFLELWSQSDDAVAFLASMEIVLFGGGPLSRHVGDKLASKGVNLHSGYGGTEFPCPTYMTPPPGMAEPTDWEYLPFDSKVPTRMVAQGDGMYELQILDSDSHPLLIKNMPDVPGYATSDLFEKHPTREGLWKIVGRADDLVILASGEKIVPGPIESKILTSPLVSGVILFGRGHNQAGILVEPRLEYVVNPLDDVASAEFRNMLWAIVEEANKEAPAYSRIFKEMILVTAQDKPMRRAAKGTVIRKATLADYAKEIDDLYARLESSEGDSVQLPKSWNEADLQEWLMAQAEGLSGRSQHREPDPDVDLFSQGFDSLSATFLRNRITEALRSSENSTMKTAAMSVPQDFVFANNTIRSLVLAIRNLLIPQAIDHAHQSHATIMDDLVKKYTTSMVKPERQDTPPLPPKATVLVTGTTGGLGSYILWMLLEDDQVERVYAFNRKSTKTALAARQNASFKERGLPTSLLTSSKLFLVEGEDAEDGLGLSNSLYEELRATCTHIIHNAWRLDFNLTVASFEPNIKGVRNLIDLALRSSYGVNFRFVFASSVSVAQGWPRDRGTFPEESDLPVDVAVGAGYGESKFVSEQLLAKAAECGLQTTTLRIGQICGGKSNGSWATTDWVPMLVKSSKALGCLPNAHGVVTWVTSDVVAQAVLDATLAKEGPPSALNILHPRPVPWSLIISGISSALAKIVDDGSNEPLPIVSFRQWVTLLEAKARDATEKDMKAIPALKILQFYQRMASSDEVLRASGRTDEETGMLPFVTEKAQSISATLREAPQLVEEDAERWIKYWHGKGLLY